MQLRLPRSSRAPLALVLAAALLGAAPFVAHAQVVDTVTAVTDWGALAHGNGDKMAIGRFNTLHAVYEDGGFVKYVTSSDGDNWTAPALVSPSAYVSALPAITVDSAGTVAVVYVGHYDSSTELGRIYYAYKPLGGGWTVSELVTSGTQPDITSNGRTVYVTWTTFDRVQYLSFGTETPPPTTTFGEEIDVNTCEGSRFVQPSVAVARRPCDSPVPRVAYLVEVDERSNPDPSCVSLVTKIGPRVCKRDDAGTWGLEWSDLVSASNPPAGVEAVSLSMNSDRAGGHLFLAWSDRSDSTERTRLAHGKNGTWAATTQENARRHVHVQPKEHGNGKFRFAWVEEGPYAPWIQWVSTDAYHRSGTWASGAAPSWIDPAPVQIDWILIGRPQAQWWGKCSSSSYSRVRVYVEAEQVCANVRLATDFETGLACPPPGGFVVAYPCDHLHAVLKASFGGVDQVDTSDLGALIEMGPTWATYDAGKGATARLEWSRGDVLSTWEGGFSALGLTDLRVIGEGIEPVLQDLGNLSEYDETCEDACTCGGGRKG